MMLNVVLCLVLSVIKIFEKKLGFKFFGFILILIFNLNLYNLDLLNFFKFSFVCDWSLLLNESNVVILYGFVYLVGFWLFDVFRLYRLSNYRI